ncbi:MAG: VCBS repeat-containing protein [Pseudomonadota bacterium]
MWRAALLLAALATGSAAAQTLTATLIEPTGRYGHNVLDGNEYAAMRVEGEGVPHVVTLPASRVFEDVEVRAADLTGDGTPELVVVEAGPGAGAEIAIYGVVEGRAERLTASPPIGRGFRWRGIAGIADFNGDGRLDIAEVVTPHLAGILRFWTLKDGELVEIADAMPGFSNHRIGQDFITSRARRCEGRYELVLTDLTWSQVMVVHLSGGEIVSRAIPGRPAQILMDGQNPCPE